MSLRDFLADAAERYRTHPLGTATRQTGTDIRHGITRRIGGYIGRSIWTRDDWDVLVILDACRFDLWDDVAPEYGLQTGETVYSNASCSINWILRNLTNRPEHLPSTGYVTANPFADHSNESVRSADLADGDLGYFRPLYKTHWQDATPDGHAEQLAEETGRPNVGSGIATVPPEAVTEHAIAAWREREALGIDRLVVHYMQPHEPYRARPEWGSGDSKLLANLIDSDNEAGSSIWPQVQDGEIPMAEFWDVYRDNLRWVLDDVDERLLGNIDGRVVLSADHGNALGEWGEWHHPSGAIGPAVRRVPWVGVNSPDLRTVTPGVDVEETSEQTGHDVETQLEALGYR